MAKNTNTANPPATPPATPPGPSPAPAPDTAAAPPGEAAFRRAYVTRHQSFTLTLPGGEVVAFAGRRLEVNDTALDGRLRASPSFGNDFTETAPLN